MDPSLIPFLLDAGAVLDELAEEPDPTALAVVSGLRKRFPAAETSALVTTAALRRRGAAKFADARNMLFTETGLEQSTADEVALHRAGRFRGFGTVADLGCGIGGDLRRLGLVAALLVGVDLSLEHLLMARHNAALVGVDPHLVRADVGSVSLAGVDAVFADPARRRMGGGRVFDPALYSPRLDVVLDGWARAVSGAAVKVAPGFPHAALPSDAEAEFVSLGGELKECVLWFGALRTPARRRATVLPAGATITGDDASPPLPSGPIGSWLFEPDPAVIRAGLVSDLAVSLGLTGVDPQIAYLTGTRRVASPFLRSWEVIEVLPFGLKRLKAALRERNVGIVTVKKRGVAVDPAALALRLRGGGSAEAVVVLTRVGDDPIAVICSPPAVPAAPA